jgi:hypothetical protein
MAEQQGKAQFHKSPFQIRAEHEEKNLVHWRHLKQRRLDPTQPDSESTFPQSQCIAGPIQPDLGNVFLQEGTNQRCLPPIQRHDVEATLDSNVRVTKLFLG